MPPFANKLRMNNLYPSMDIETEDDPLFNQFKQKVIPSIRRNNRIQQIIPPIQQQETGQIPPRDFLREPMNVQFQPPMSELSRFADRITPLQQKELELKERGLNIDEKRYGETNAINKAKLADTQRKTDIADFKAKNPGIKIIAPKGGRVQAVNSATGEVIRDFGDTGTMDEAERIALEQTGRIELAKETGEQARTTEGVRQKGRETLEEAKARHAKELKELESGAPSSADLPSQQRTETLRKAEQARNTHPEWSKYIKIVPGGGFVITAPGKVFGPSAEEYKKINDFIYSTTPTDTKKPEESKPKENLKAVRDPKTGKLVLQ